MSSVNDNAIDAIIKGIFDALKSKTEKLSSSEVFSSPIYGVNTDGTYTIVKEKNRYNVKNGLSITLFLGQNVWVMIPNGSFKDMFIFALN